MLNTYVYWRMVISRNIFFTNHIDFIRCWTWRFLYRRDDCWCMRYSRNAHWIFREHPRRISLPPSQTPKGWYPLLLFYLNNQHWQWEPSTSLTFKCSIKNVSSHFWAKCEGQLVACFSKFACGSSTFPYSGRCVSEGRQLIGISKLIIIWWSLSESSWHFS